MARAERQDLTAVLTLQDQLSGPLAAAKQNLVSAETGLGRLDATARAAGSSLGGLGSSLGAVAKAGVITFAAFKSIEVLGDAIGAAREEERSIAGLTASIKANDEAWDGNRTAIEDVLQSRLRLGHSDDEQRNALVGLVAATHNVTQALELERTAMDLAAFKQIDLGAASQALVSIEAGRYRALAQLGIQIKANATQEEALAAVQKVVAGSAEALAATNEGKLTASNVRLGESLERIGSHLIGPVTDGMVLLADVVGGVADALGGLGDILGGVGNEIGGVVDNFKELDTVKSQEAQTTIAYNLALNQLQDAFANGRISQDEYITRSRALSDSFDAAAVSTQGFTVATESSGEALDNIAGRAIAAAQAQQALNASVFQGHDFFSQFTTDAKDTGAGLDNIAAEARAAAAGLDTSHEAVNRLRDSLDDLPRDISITIDVGLTGAGAGAFAQGFPTTATPAGNTDFGPTNPSTGSLTGTSADPEVIRRQREADAARAAEEAARRAKQAAEELARAYKDKVSAEFANAKKTADTLFDALHNRNQQAIDDAEKLAQKQHDAALQAIADNLKAEQAAHAAPVNAAEAALRQRQEEEQRRNLVESLQAAQQAAQANTDPAKAADLAKTLRDATEALANFDAQAAIDRLKAVQAGLDQQSQAAADAAKSQADKDFEAAKAKADADTKAETIAAQKRKEQFDAQLAALQKRDTAAGKTPDQIQKDIEALEKRFGIFIDPVTGFHHIEDATVRAIKDIKIDPPAVTVINNQHFLLQIGPNELRLLASELQKNANPAASSGVRTGSGGSGR